MPCPYLMSDVRATDIERFPDRSRVVLVAVGARHAVPGCRLGRTLSVDLLPSLAMDRGTASQPTVIPTGVEESLAEFGKGGFPFQREIPRLRLRPPLGMTIDVGLNSSNRIRATRSRSGRCSRSPSPHHPG